MLLNKMMLGPAGEVENTPMEVVGYMHLFRLRAHVQAIVNGEDGATLTPSNSICTPRLAH